MKRRIAIIVAAISGLLTVLFLLTPEYKEVVPEALVEETTEMVEEEAPLSPVVETKATEDPQGFSAKLTSCPFLSAEEIKQIRQVWEEDKKLGAVAALPRVPDPDVLSEDELAQVTNSYFDDMTPSVSEQELNRQRIILQERFDVILGRKKELFLEWQEQFRIRVE